MKRKYANLNKEVIFLKTSHEQEFIRFGLKVAYYRKLRGLTQEALADMVGISWSHLAKVEGPACVYGVSMNTLFSIAEALNIPTSKLFED